MLKDVESVTDASVPTSTPVKPAVRLLPVFARHKTEESELGTFRGLLFALPLGVMLWLLVFVLVYFL